MESEIEERKKLEKILDIIMSNINDIYERIEHTIDDRIYENKIFITFNINSSYGAPFYLLTKLAIECEKNKINLYWAESKNNLIQIEGYYKLIKESESQTIVHCYFCGKELKIKNSNYEKGRYICSDCINDYYNQFEQYGSDE